MEPSSNLPPDKAAAAMHQQNKHHPDHPHHHQAHNHPPRPSTSSSASSGISLASSSAPGQGAGIERLCRPAAFDKMESIVREMQDTECGVPVRSQKLFLTSIPSAFMGYDLIEWLMERLSIEESEALNIANQLCLHGYFFPVNDAKNLVVKDDSSLYRFQTPYFWPWQHKAPDNIEYAIYLTKRSLRNKQRHGLEEYETDALTSLHKNLKGKWDFITMQAEEQVKLCKERKKGDKIVSDSQEKAYWRVHRPPPGQFTPLESCPVPSRDRKPRKRTVEDGQKELDFLKKSEAMTRVKMSQACDLLIQYFEVFSEYDPLMQPALPSNPWVTEDTTFWTLNSAIVEMPTEKRVKKWSISIEELVSDPTGLQEFTNYLKKEYSHENIRFWTTVNDLRRSAHSQIAKKVREIYEEFLEPGAPCEINIDGKTMEKVQSGLKNPTRFTFDAAADHIFSLLLKKDCYPRFIRSEHYKMLLATGIQPAHKKRFFGFGGAAKKKSSSATPPNAALMAQSSASSSGQSGLGRRRGSDRSLTGSAHELAVSGVKDASSKVHHSHSQSNLCDIPYRGDMPSGGMAMSEKSDVHVVGAKIITKIPESAKALADTLEVHSESSASCSVCPWDTVPTAAPATGAAAAAKSKKVEAPVSVSICPWEEDVKSPPPPTIPIYLEKASDIGEVSERMKRSCGLRQSTLDSDFHSTKNLMPDVSTQRRASITITPRISEYSLLSGTGQVHHGASIPGIFTSTLPVRESTQTYSQHSLSMDSSQSVDDPSVGMCRLSSCTPDALVTVQQQDSLAEDMAEVEDKVIIQELPVIQVQADEAAGDGGGDSVEQMQVTVMGISPTPTTIEEECCDCDETAQTFISTNNTINNTIVSTANCNNGTLPAPLMMVTEEEVAIEQVVVVSGENNIPSRCCCDPIEDSVVVAGQDTVLYDKREVDDKKEQEAQEYDRCGGDDNKNNNNPVIGSGGTSVSPDNINRRLSTETLKGVEVATEGTVPAIKISATSVGGGVHLLQREASIEGDEFMIQSRTASEEQKSESPVVIDPSSCEPMVTGSISSSDNTNDGDACDACQTEAKQHLQQQHPPPLNQPQRQSTDVQSSDLEFEDCGPEDGARFLLRGCVAPAPTPAPMIAPLAEVEQDPQDFGEEEENEDEKEDVEGRERMICDKLKQHKDLKDVSSTVSASIAAPGCSGGGLEKQQSNESDLSKTPPPELHGMLSEENKKDIAEPIPIYACTSGGSGVGPDGAEASGGVKNENPPPAANTGGVKKRRKKREGATTETKAEGDDGAAAAATGGDAEPKGDPVCPWEDEDVSSSVDVPFVKTYATLGYL